MSQPNTRPIRRESLLDLAPYTDKPSCSSAARMPSENNFAIRSSPGSDMPSWSKSMCSARLTRYCQ